MNDNALIAIVITTLQAGFAAQSLTPVVQQSYQPTVQGVPTADTVMLHKTLDNRYGFPKRVDTFTNGVMTQTETEWIETTYQLGALVTQNPSNTTQLTAADYLKAAARYMQSETGINLLLGQGVGIYRIRPIRQTYFMDDRGRYESSPMLEFTVTHQDTLALVIGSTDVITGEVTGIFAAIYVE